MTHDWLDALRKDIENIDYDSIDEQSGLLAEYLKSIAKESSFGLGVSNQALKLAFEIKAASKPTSSFESRLLDTMRRAHVIRTYSFEAQEILRDKSTFGEALQKLCESVNCDSEQLQSIPSVADPRALGVDALVKIAKGCRLSFLRLLSLVASSLESCCIKRRNELVYEGLARASKGISVEERRQQEIQAADSLLGSEKQSCLDFLRELTIASINKE